MAGFLDFLFEGKPPKSVTTYGQTIQGVPKWLSDYTQGIIARANAAAAEPYIPYGGPRIAPFAPEEEAAFRATPEAATAYQPYLEGAGAGTAGALMESMRGFPGNVERYINPYIENVLNRQESLAGRTLEEKFLPALQRRFIGAGQYGSRGGIGSMEDIGVKGLRDISENLEEQRLATLGGAYGQAADIFGADIGRQLNAARQMGALGEAAQTLGLRGAGALEAVGRTRREQGQRSLDLALQDFLEQRNLPFERLGFMNQIIRGLPYERATTTTNVGPADVYQPSPLSQILGGIATYKGLTSARGGLARASDVIDLSPEDYEVLNYG